MNRIQKLLRIARTVRYLRPPQIYWRVIRKFYKPTASTGPAPELRPSTGSWQEPPARPSVMMDATTLEFLGEVHSLAKPADWFLKADAKVITYNLHYFDDLVMHGWQDRIDWHRSLIDRWIDEVPLGQGLGWDAYPTALRIVNWIKWNLAGNAISEKERQSLAVQMRHLRLNIEWQLLGNHVLANGKGLLFGGVWFGGEEGNAWLQLGFKILAAEFREEIMPDGGHYERSPMYHSIMLEDLLDGINLVAAYPDAFSVAQKSEAFGWRAKSTQMLEYLRDVVHPDQEISQFNDAGRAIPPSLIELETYAERLGVPIGKQPTKGLKSLPDTGFVRLQTGSLWMLCDVGEVGPAYQPGHAHADTLTFEASLFGQRLIVNSGTSTYAICPRRDHERGTSAHNTVVVDGQDSSEVWASFRVASRAHPYGLKLDSDQDEFRIVCSHDGYRRLPGKVSHKREWTVKPGMVEIVDTLEGSYRTAEAFLHFAPAVKIQQRGNELYGDVDGHEFSVSISGADLRLEEYQYSPSFGRLQPSVCAIATFNADRAIMRLTWNEA
jgi:uncharacterized heparinase superfamily protein